MSRSMADVLAALDELEAPDLWDDIEARSQRATPSKEPTLDGFAVDDDHDDSSSPGLRRKLLVAAAGAVVAVVVAVVALINAAGDEQGGVDTVDSPPTSSSPTTTSLEIDPPPATADTAPSESADADGITVVPNPFPNSSVDDPSFDLPAGPEIEVGEVIDVSGQFTRVESDIELPFDDPEAIVNFTDLAADGTGSDWVGASYGVRRSYLVRLDSVTGQVAATVEIGTGSVGAPVVGEGAVWIVRNEYGNEERRGSLVRVDPATGQVVATIEIGPGPVNGPVIADGAVWVTGYPPSDEDWPTYRGALYRVDPATDSVVAVVDFPPFREVPLVPGFSGEVVASDDAVWVTARVDERPVHTLFRVDPATNAVVAVIEFADVNTGRAEIAVAEDALWVSGFTGVVYRVDKADNTVEAIDLGIRTQDLVVGDGAVWVTTRFSVYRIDPTTNTFDVVHGPPHDVPQAVPGIDLSGFGRITGPLVLVDDALFVQSDNMVGSVNNKPNHLLRIDTSSLSLDATYSVGDLVSSLDGPRGSRHLAVVDDMLWIGSYRLPLAAVSGSPAG